MTTVTSGTPFKVSLSMATPFSLPSRLTLDGLLASAVFTETGLTHEDNDARIPLDSQDGIFRASSIFFSGRHDVPRGKGDTKVVRVGGLLTPLDLEHPAIGLGQRGGPKSDDFKEIFMTRYTPMRALDPVVFFGCGDPERVQFLLEHFIIGLGSGHTRGYGAIARVEVTPESEDLSWVLEDGSPARPVPVELWQTLDGVNPVEQCVRSQHAVRNPYWQTPRVACVLPERWSLEPLAAFPKAA